MALLPLPPPGPLAQVTTIRLCRIVDNRQPNGGQRTGIDLLQRGIREADGSVTGVGWPYLHFRSDHAADVKFNLAV